MDGNLTRGDPTEKRHRGRGEGRGGRLVRTLLVRLAGSRDVAMQGAYTEVVSNLGTTAGDGANERIT